MSTKGWSVTVIPDLTGKTAVVTGGAPVCLAGAANMSQTINEAAAEFMAVKHVAVTGVSRNPQGHGSNVVY
jgi:hypothetical protein